MNGRLAAMIGIAACAAGCGAGEPAESGPVVRDSAGITIVENTAPAWEREAWTVSAEPVVDIGVVDGAPEYQLHRVQGAARLSDGRIIVANGGTHELRFYDADGRHLLSAGREGDGPGELRTLAWLDVLPGDSIVVFDWRRGQISVYGPDGSFVRSAALPPISEGGMPFPVAVFSSGTLLVRSNRLFGLGEVAGGVSRDTSLYVRVSLGGEILDTVGSFAGTTRFARPRQGEFSVIPLTFGRHGAMAVDRDIVYYGSQDHYEIEVRAEDGSLRGFIRLAQEPPPVTPADIEAARRQLLAETIEAFRTQLEEMFAERPFPRTMPAHGPLKVDAEGNLWVAEYLPPGGEQPRWRVFDPDRRLLGTVEMPPGVDVYEIGGDYVLGKWTDEFEVEHVRVYRLTRSGGAP